MAAKVVGIRRDADPYTVRPDLSHHGLNYLKGKSTAVLQAASILVNTIIDTIFHELLNEEAMGTMDFNPVKTCI